MRKRGRGREDEGKALRENGWKRWEKRENKGGKEKKKGQAMEKREQRVNL